MSSDRFNRLLELATDEEQAELKIFRNSEIKTLKKYKDDPTAASKKDLDSARGGLENLMTQLEQKYNLAGPSSDPPFRSLSAVLRHLKDAGYKIQKSKLYKDKDRGIIRIQPDGTVLAADVAAYALTLKSAADKKNHELHEKKLRMELEKLTEQVETIRFSREKDQGRYLPRSDFEQELAARAMVLDTGLRHLIQTQAVEWIALAGGQTRKTPELIERVNADLDRLMNEYARTDTFQVMVIESDSSDEINE